MVFKNEFIKHYLELYGGTKKDAVQAYDNTFECLADLLYGEGQEVCVRDLGTFKIKEFKARNSTHPGTGLPMVLPARKVVTFKQARLVNEIEEDDAEGTYI